MIEHACNQLRHIALDLIATSALQACRRAVNSVAEDIWSVQKITYLHMSWLDIIDFPQPLWHGFRRYFGTQTRRADCVSLS
eukprot:1156469-Pelagomonas_calceolata.AAC.7